MKGTKFATVDTGLFYGESRAGCCLPLSTMFGAEEKVTGMSMVLSKWIITPITATVAAPTQSNEEFFFVMSQVSFTLYTTRWAPIKQLYR